MLLKDIDNRCIIGKSLYYIKKGIVMSEVQIIKKMSKSEFQRFGNLIYSDIGIKMPFSKKLMLESRLNKRLRAVGVNSFSEYYDLVVNSESIEYSNMVNAVTTNKTDFFRESDHFDYLINIVLPEFINTSNFLESRKLKIWSAGSSTGKEAYTIAMVLHSFFLKLGKYDFKILGTDVSTEVLDKAKNGVYSNEKIRPIHSSYKKKYLMAGKGRKNGFHRIVPELREKVDFKELNFMENSYNIKGKMDIIFCRNVVIYFDKETQIELFNKLYNHLNTGGYLFIGSSETLNGINNKFISVGPSVYKKV